MSNYVKVVWRDISGVDSANNSSAWFTQEQLLKKGIELYNQEYFSVGEIVVETNEFIILAATTDNDKEEPLYSDLSMIPKAVIIRIEKL